MHSVPLTVITPEAAWAEAAGGLCATTPLEITTGVAATMTAGNYIAGLETAC